MKLSRRWLLGGAAVAPLLTFATKIGMTTPVAIRGGSGAKAVAQWTAGSITSVEVTNGGADFQFTGYGGGFNYHES